MAVQALGLPPALGILFEVGAVGDLPDGALLDRFAQGGEGSEAAFRALLDRHGSMVLRVCRRMLADPNDAEDAFQATFLVLLRRAGSIRDRDSVAAWLHGVAVRVGSRARVEAARRRRIERRGPAPAIGRDAEADRLDLAELIDAELARLPEKYRRPIVLCYLEGLTHEGAAARLGWPVGTVRGRLARGRDLLRSRLVRRGASASVALAAVEAIAAPARAAVPSAARESAVRLATGSIVATGRVAAWAAGASPGMVGRRVMAAVMAVGLFGSGIGLAIRAAGPPAPRGQEAPTSAVAGPARGDAAEEPGRTVEGIVVDEAGRPVAGARVRIARYPKASDEAVSGADGRFVLRYTGSMGIADEEVIASTPDGRSQGTATVPGSFDGTPTAPVRVVVRPSLSVVVTVRDAVGSPVADAAVEIADASVRWASGRTDHLGRVELRYPDGLENPWLLALKPGAGFDFFEDPWRAFPPFPSAVSLVLDGTRPRKVKLVDSRGKPLVGVELHPAMIRRRARRGQVAPWASVAMRARSDRDGVVTFDWFPADGGPSIPAILVPCDYDYPPSGYLPLGEPGQIPTATLLRKVVLRGKVLRPDGRPAPGILVEASGTGKIDRGLGRSFGRTGEDGSYSIQVPPERAYMVTVSDRSWASASRTGIVLDREGGAYEVPDLRLVRGTVLRGRMTAGPDNLPVPGANVVLWGLGERLPAGFNNSSADRETQIRHTQTDADGRYQLRIGPGSYVLDAYGFRTRESIEVGDEPEIVRDFHSEGVDGVVKHHLRGLVLDPTDGRGEPVPGALVSTFGGRGPGFDGRADDRGRFDLLVLYDPRYLYARNADGSRAGLGTVRRGEHLGLVKVRPAGRVVGRVVDDRGQPLADWPVWLRMKGRPGTDAGWYVRQARTDDRGQYAFDGVILGAPCDLGTIPHRGTPQGDEPIPRVDFTPSAPGQILADLVVTPIEPDGQAPGRRVR